ncbi:MAG TPA: hypothetical protein VK815_05090 [Candidatus Acidoferrales bacterium]|jgi:hypothetical protein|nr:hypothetical protein [Candidatus Acidoferrales bacterium]
MNLKTSHPLRRRGTAAFTLIEMLVGTALGVVVIGSMMSLYMSGAISFSAMGNYQNLDAKSYNALDLISREVRNSNILLSYVNNQSLVLSNNYANNGAGQITTINYDSSAGNVTLKRASGTNSTTVNLLTGCDQMSFQLYSHAPNTNSFSTNVVFFNATNAAQCKMIQISWKCSRTVKGYKLNTESVQTAQIVLRNKTQ